MRGGGGEGGGGTNMTVGVDHEAGIRVVSTESSALESHHVSTGVVVLSEEPAKPDNSDQALSLASQRCKRQPSSVRGT